MDVKGLLLVLTSVVLLFIFTGPKYVSADPEPHYRFGRRGPYRPFPFFPWPGLFPVGRPPFNRTRSTASPNATSTVATESQASNLPVTASPTASQSSDSPTGPTQTTTTPPPAPGRR